MLLLCLSPYASPFATSYFCIFRLMLLHLSPHAPTPNAPTPATSYSYTCQHMLHLPPLALGVPFSQCMISSSCLKIDEEVLLPIVIFISILVERVFINTTYWQHHTTIISSRFQVISQINRALFSFTIRNIEVHLGLMSCFDDLSNLYFRFVQLSSI